ncbi:NAD synthetase [Caballeronia arvi]|uniref:NAD synthetase n=1 Tax=Caballeronia arvi TaxID=1777135 RepID=A0A158L0A0_9BURK|nr:NAD synthetase [Caballeronia arvi]
MNLASDDLKAWQLDVIAELGVGQRFDEGSERERRIAFLSDYLTSHGPRTDVLGISGGVDLLAAGRLAQLSVERLCARRYEAHFVAVRLPYGAQRDEEDAQRALNFVRPDETLTVDTQSAADDMLRALEQGARSMRTIISEILCLF